jgi:hypothetical protein
MLNDYVKRLPVVASLSGLAFLAGAAGSAGGTGIALYKGAIYAEVNDRRAGRAECSSRGIDPSGPVLAGLRCFI